LRRPPQGQQNGAAGVEVGQHPVRLEQHRLGLGLGLA
jgi:hypothetical protein